MMITGKRFIELIEIVSTEIEPQKEDKLTVNLINQSCPLLLPHQDNPLVNCKYYYSLNLVVY